jgi:hypothetical protein
MGSAVLTGPDLRSSLRSARHPSPHDGRGERREARDRRHASPAARARRVDIPQSRFRYVPCDDALHAESSGLSGGGMQLPPLQTNPSTQSLKDSHELRQVEASHL